MKVAKNLVLSFLSIKVSFTGSPGKFEELNERTTTRQKVRFTGSHGKFQELDERTTTKQH